MQDLLDLARLDAHRFSLDLVAVDAASAVRQVVDGFRPSAAELGIELLAAQGSSAALWVQADADRLVQVLANLVENASSFARTQVVVGSAAVAGIPTLWVVDDGPGIPGEQLARVFERHFVSDRVSGRRKGSGLGLAIVSELVTAMGGTVEAESPVAEKGGTRLVVRLQPASDPSAGAPPALQATGPRPAS